MKDYRIKHPFHEKYGFSSEIHFVFAIAKLLEKLINAEKVENDNNNNNIKNKMLDASKIMDLEEDACML